MESKYLKELALLKDNNEHSLCKATIYLENDDNTLVVNINKELMNTASIIKKETTEFFLKVIKLYDIDKIYGSSKKIIDLFMLSLKIDDGRYILDLIFNPEANKYLVTDSSAKFYLKEILIPASKLLENSFNKTIKDIVTSR